MRRADLSASLPNFFLSLAFPVHFLKRVSHSLSQSSICLFLWGETLPCRSSLRREPWHLKAIGPAPTRNWDMRAEPNIHWRHIPSSQSSVCVLWVVRYVALAGLVALAASARNDFWFAADVGTTTNDRWTRSLAFCLLGDMGIWMRGGIARSSRSTWIPSITWIFRLGEPQLICIYKMKIPELWFAWCIRALNCCRQPQRASPGALYVL